MARNQHGRSAFPATSDRVIIVYGRGESDGYAVAALAVREEGSSGVERFRAFMVPRDGPEVVIDAGGSYFAINGKRRPNEYFEIVALPRPDESYGHIWRRFSDALTPMGRALLCGVLPDVDCPFMAFGRLVRLMRDEKNTRYVLKTCAVLFDPSIEADHAGRRAGVYLWGANGDGLRKFAVVPQYDRDERVRPLFVAGHVDNHQMVDRFALE